MATGAARCASSPVAWMTRCVRWGPRAKTATARPAQRTCSVRAASAVPGSARVAGAPTNALRAPSVSPVVARPARRTSNATVTAASIISAPMRQRQAAATASWSPASSVRTETREAVTDAPRVARWNRASFHAAAMPSSFPVKNAMTGTHATSMGVIVCVSSSPAAAVTASCRSSLGNSVNQRCTTHLSPTAAATTVGSSHSSAGTARSKQGKNAMRRRTTVTRSPTAAASTVRVRVVATACSTKRKCATMATGSAGTVVTASAAAKGSPLADHPASRQRCSICRSCRVCPCFQDGPPVL